MRSLRWVLLGGSILLAAIAGCGDDNHTGPGPNQQPIYLDSSTPLNVLHNMRIAYESRDTTAYISLFDANYQGASYDPSGPGQLTFSKGDEAQHIRGLLRSSTITSVSLTFPPVLNRFTDISDPPGWATVQMAGAGLGVEINDGPTTYTLLSGTMEFKFLPTTPALGSPTDTTWQIVRWYEFP